MSENLVQAGFSVLRYDYYGHGYSKYGNGKFFNYDKDMFVDQLDDLMDYIEKEEGLKPEALCGHSTGGIVSVAANHRWHGSERSVVPKLVLFNPAFYANKSFVAKLIDCFSKMFPRILPRLIKYFQFLIGNEYLKAVDTAFAKDPDTNKYIYPAAHEKKKNRDRILFGKLRGMQAHPFLRPGIFNINCNTLRGDLFPGHFDMLNETLNKSPESKILWLWGKLDETVPYADNIKNVISLDEKNDNLEVKGLDRIGHESPYEDSKLLSSLTISFLK
mmetsp:Transcript_33378/g.70162  ORF Transcript_33378/g.70162 Transcript_33378/m.70162 type:complete len:274 (+) Transcript_33378:392-1213(+)